MTHPVLPGAEPWEADGGPVGALVVHGFTGNPQSMRPLAEALAAAGATVSLPLLPGHGTDVADMVPTRWEDWSGAALAAYDALAARCERVLVAGLSMGGTLSLWLATQRPVAGLVLVNPLADGTAPGITGTVEALTQLQADGVELVPGIGSDIALPGSVEIAYPQTPVAALLSLHGALAPLRADLARITCPVVLLTSPQDHVVEPVSSDLVAASVSGPVERVSLERSFHVATLDHDADLIAERAVALLRQVSSDTA